MSFPPPPPPESSPTEDAAIVLRLHNAPTTTAFGHLLWAAPPRLVYTRPFLLSLRHSKRLPLSPDDPIRRPVPSRRVYTRHFLLSLRYANQPSVPLERLSEDPIWRPTASSAPVCATGVVSDVELSSRDAHVTFDDLALPGWMVAALGRLGMVRPTPVQLAALPVARRGVDVIAQAKSGTGKTVVFCVVAVERAKGMRNGPVVLILVPTRELGEQIFGVLRVLAGGVGVSVALLIGGRAERDDERKLMERPGVVVGTPGRVLAMMERGALDGGGVRLLVLDEADRLIDGSMGDAVPRVCQFLEANKQTLAFSATFPGRLERLLKRVMRRPQHVQMCKGGEEEGERGVHRKAVLVAVQQRKTAVVGDDRASRLKSKVRKLVSYLSENPFSFCIVFMNDKRKVTDVIGEVEMTGFLCTYINSGMAQRQRAAVMKGVRSGNVQVLLSTDLLARGVDIDSCDLVVHLDTPNDSATYLHRVGRAGRFGRMGLSLVIYSEEEDGANLRNLETELGFQLEQQGFDQQNVNVEGNPAKSDTERPVEAEPAARDGRSVLGLCPEAHLEGFRTHAKGPSLRLNDRGQVVLLHEDQEDTGELHGHPNDVNDGSLMQLASTCKEELQIDGETDTAEMDMEPPQETECMNSNGEPEPLSNYTSNEASIGADPHMQTRGAFGEENSSSVPNCDKAWEQFAQDAYDKGYKEAYELGFQMAMQLRARLGGHY